MKGLKSNQRGVTLMEILVGIVLVAVISIATLSYFAYGLGGIGKEGNRRAALERARQRLEQMMEVGVTAVKPPIDGTQTPDSQPVHWVDCENGGCTRTTTYVLETVSVDELPQQRIESTVQWRDDASANTPDDPDTLELTVKVWFTRDLIDDDFHRVYLKTLRTP